MEDTVSDACSKDYLEIVDGKNENSENRFEKFCGTDVPGSLISSGNQLIIKFKSDYSITSKGFEVYYDIGNCCDSCQFIVSYENYFRQCDMWGRNTY